MILKNKIFYKIKAIPLLDLTSDNSSSEIGVARSAKYLRSFVELRMSGNLNMRKLKVMARPARKIAALSIVSTLWIVPSDAQVSKFAPKLHNYSTVDANNVDVMSGEIVNEIPLLSVGPFSVSLKNERTVARYSFEHKITYIPASGRGQQPQFIVQDGPSRHSFFGSGALPAKRDGSSLVLNSERMVYIFTNRAGDVMEFPSNIIVPVVNRGFNERWAIFREAANGHRLTFYRRQFQFTDGNGNSQLWERLQGIESNMGWGLKLEYQSSLPIPNGSSEAGDRMSVTKITGFNRSVEYCNLSADICAFQVSWPAYGIWQTSSSSFGYTDAAGAQYDWTQWNTVVTKPGIGLPSFNYFYSVRPPLGASAGVICTTLPYSETNRPPQECLPRHVGVQRASKYGQNWEYELVEDGPAEQRHRASKVTGPSGEIATMKGWADDQFRPYEATDALGRTTRWQYTDIPNASLLVHKRLTSIIYADGRKVDFTYDDRENILTETLTPFPTSVGSPLTVSATYPTTCTSRPSCNKPVSIVDARGNVTSFTYDPGHGGTLTQTSPAVNGVSPVKRYSYVSRRAWVRPTSGVGFIQDTGAVWLLEEERTCLNTATISGGCAGGGADELVTRYEYGSDAGPNNLLVRGQVVTSNGQSLRTCFTYDQLGRKIAETKPKANLGACP